MNNDIVLDNDTSCKLIAKIAGS